MPTRLDRLARRPPRALVLREERKPIERGPLGRKPLSPTELDGVLADHMDRIANTPAPLNPQEADMVARYLGRVHRRMGQGA